MGLAELLIGMGAACFFSLVIIALVVGFESEYGKFIKIISIVFIIIVAAVFIIIGLKLRNII